MHILTFDYELFGSGSGDVIKDLVEPTYRILDILEKHKIKAIFFVEQLEVDAIINLKYVYPANSTEYQNALALENQINKIILSGHDIQLHLHPQWFGAKYSGGKWHLNYQWWRFSSLPYRTSKDGMPGMYDLLLTGKESLEARLRLVKPSYECYAFRAGGYNIGITSASIDALVNSGFYIDSSVCPGYFSSAGLSRYDYTKRVSCDSYICSQTDLLEDGNIDNGLRLVEVPLLTMKSSFMERLSIARVYAYFRNKKNKSIGYTEASCIYEPYNCEKMTNSNYDVCLSSNRQLKKFRSINAGIECRKNHHVVLIGHPKDYSIFSPLNRMLEDLKQDNGFITFDYIRQSIK